MLIGAALLSRVSAHSPYLTAIALPMVVFGVGQGLGLSTLTTAGMAGVAPDDAGAAGGLVNVAHHLGGAVGLGVLVTVFAAAGSGARNTQDLLAQRVSASLTAAAGLLLVALLVTLVANTRKASRAGARPVEQLSTARNSPVCRFARQEHGAAAQRAIHKGEHHANHQKLT